MNPVLPGSSPGRHPRIGVVSRATCQPCKLCGQGSTPCGSTIGQTVGWPGGLHPPVRGSAGFDSLADLRSLLLGSERPRKAHGVVRFHQGPPHSGVVQREDAGLIHPRWGFDSLSPNHTIPQSSQRLGCRSATPEVGVRLPPGGPSPSFNGRIPASQAGDGGSTPPGGSNTPWP